MQASGVKTVQYKSSTKELPKGKFLSNWERPFRVREVAKGGAYHLEWLSGKIVPRTWNAMHFKFYYS